MLHIKDLPTFTHILSFPVKERIVKAPYTKQVMSTSNVVVVLVGIQSQSYSSVDFAHLGRIQMNKR
jgi:hypothetical protein